MTAITVPLTCDEETNRLARQLGDAIAGAVSNFAYGGNGLAAHTIDGTGLAYTIACMNDDYAVRVVCEATVDERSSDRPPGRAPLNLDIEYIRRQVAGRFAVQVQSRPGDAALTLLFVPC